MRDIPFDGDIRAFYNRHGDLIEINVFYFFDHIEAFALLGEDEPVYRDFTGEGRHRASRKKAIQMAIVDLNGQAYGLEKRSLK